jgi:DNA-directed RNA polymerase specialized sigma24 family protein
MLDLMSPLPLRRYRAERLLSQQFDGLRGRVLAGVRGRLTRTGVRLDGSDLEACYAQAWQGLYAATLAGQQIANPAGWLVLVTYRRALEEHRARARLRIAPGRGTPATDEAGSLDADAACERLGVEPDLAAGLDDRLRLRALVEGMRGRLDEREREAAALCYLHGLSRAEAAAQMGLSERRMRKLMEGRAPGRPGVSSKMAGLLQTIQDGGWCDEQASLMRAFAYGILDPQGERYQLAVMHRRACPACRSYVASLRGLAVVLPPALAPLAAAPGPLAAGAATHGTGPLAAAKGGAAAGSSAAGGAGSAVAAGAGSGVGGATIGGAAAAGSGWLALGGAKLAVGCLLAVGLGVGCAALIPSVPPGAPAQTPRRAPPGARPALAHVSRHPVVALAPAWVPRTAAARRARPAARPVRASGSTAVREFSLEQAAAGAGAPGPPPAPAAKAASASGGSSRAGSAGPASAAEREFSPG